MKIKYPAYARKLISMLESDQRMREGHLKKTRSWDSRYDYRHTEALRKIIEEIGWPTRSQVGARAAKAACLLIRHADHDRKLQCGCLTLMRFAADGDMDLAEFAYLTDRVRVNTGRLQLYGTQFYEVNGTYIPRPIEDERNIDMRRKAMGLPTLREGIVAHHRKYAGY